jgi:PTS system mannose-specific IIA component
METKKTETIQNESAVGVVLVTHTDYGARLIKAAEFILGPQDDCLSVSVDATNDVSKTLDHLKHAVREADKGAGVMILTDMFGGTPTNLSLSLLGSFNLEVVTGVNMPMLLKVMNGRRMPLQKLAQEAKIAGALGIVVAGEVLRKKLGES